MTTDAYHALEALVKAIEAETHSRTPPPRSTQPGCVITVSRSCGSGGDTIARRLAERFNLRYFDQDIISAIAKEARVDENTVRLLDEQGCCAMRAAWLRSMFGGESLFKDTYRQILVGVVFGILRTGGVILGRGANFILDRYPVFRLRVVGSPEVCAQRIAKERGMSAEEALAELKKIDRTRAEFIKNLCHHDINDPVAYDLVLNTDHMAIDEAPAVILEAMRHHDLARSGEVHCLFPEAPPPSP